MIQASTSGADRAVSARLAEFAVKLHWEDIPAAVRHEAKRSLLNFFATSLGGCREDAVTTAWRVMQPLAGPSCATVIGHSLRTDMLGAAWLNAMSANVFDFDDTHERTIIHPTAPVAAALLALAQNRPVAGRDFLLALVLGIESQCRIGNAISPGHYRRGWHITSTCGVFGSAMAAGTLLGLDVQQQVWALGNASVQAGGLVETLGTMAKSISVGNAARNGLLSAMLAEAGLAGPAEPLEGARGFLRVTGENPDFDEVVGELGMRWEAGKNAYKPYPCGVVLNPVIEACLALRRDSDFTLEEVESVTLTGHPLLRERTDRPGIVTGRQAQVSAQHSVAVALAYGHARLQEFTDAVVADPALQSFGRKLRFVDDSSYAVESARVDVVVKGGRCLSYTVQSARGCAANPLSDADLEQKLFDLAAYGRADVDCDALVREIWRLDEAVDVAPLMVLASGRAA
jgi:2-methylcitrate dehydratase PrpD